MRGVQASLDRVLGSLHPGATRPASDSATAKPPAQPSRLLDLLGGGENGGNSAAAKPTRRPKRRRREQQQRPDGGDEDCQPSPSARGGPSDRAGACPVCGVRLPPAELAAHVDAEVAAALASDDDDGGGGGRVDRPPPSPHGDATALLPPRPAPAVPAVFGSAGGRATQAPPPPPPRPSSTQQPRVPAWAATLAAVAARPGRVDHYSDARAITMAGEALGIDGVAGAAAGWEVAGASGLGAAGLNGEQV